MKWKASPVVFGLALIIACSSNPPIPDAMTFSSDPLVGKIVWHDLITGDIDAAREFYSGLFGWTFESSVGPEGRPYALARDGDIYVAGLVEAQPDDGVNVSRWLPFVSVPDVDRAARIGTAMGGDVAVAPRDVPRGRVAAVIDLEGAVIGLARSSIGDPDDRTTAAAPGRVVWTELLSDNPNGASQFYGQLVGYESRTIERRGGQYTMLGAAGQDRAGVMANPSPDWSPVWLTYFGVDDPSAAASLAQSLGGTVVLPASPDLREGTMAVVTDPSGAILVLQQWTAE